MDNTELLDKFNELRNLKDYKAILVLSDTILQEDENNFESLKNKAFALRNLKENEEAIKAYKKIINLRPDFKEILNNLALLLDSQKHFEEGLSYWDKLIELEPNNSKHWMYKGFDLDELGKYEEALECLNKSIKIDPKMDKELEVIKESIVNSIKRKSDKDMENQKVNKDNQGSIKMGEIIIPNVVKRERGYLYYIDGKGNLCRALMDKESSQNEDVEEIKDEEDEEVFDLEESVETLIKEQENPSIEILNGKSVEEIKEDIKKLIPLNEDSSFNMYKYIEDYLLDYNLTTHEIPYGHKLTYKIDKVKRLLEKEIEERLKKEEQNKKEVIKKILNQKLEIILLLVEWAKQKSITHNIFSHKDILVFLRQKGYIPNEDNFHSDDFREIWLEVKGELKKTIKNK